MFMCVDGMCVVMHVCYCIVCVYVVFGISCIMLGDDMLCYVCVIDVMLCYAVALYVCVVQCCMCEGVLVCYDIKCRVCICCVCNGVEFSYDVVIVVYVIVCHVCSVYT